MLLAFSISQTALEGLDTLEPSELRSLTESFCRFWIKHGICIENSRDDNHNSLPSLVKKTPQTFRKRFVTVYKTGRKQRVPTMQVPLLACTNETDISLYTSDVALYLVEENCRSDYGIPQYDLSVQFGEQEYCVFRFVHNSKRLELAQDNSRTDVAAGEPTNSVFDTYFEPFARAANRVVVVDRYAMKQHTEAVKNHQVSGMVNFLSRLYTVKPSIDVKVITSVKGVDSIRQSDFIRDLEFVKNNANAKNIELHRVDDQTFGQQQHSRYIRFDGDVLEIDTGLEVLQGTAAYRKSPISHRSGSKMQLKKSEATIEAANASGIGSIII
jgi:predicted SnoaL-like aldol condensation-catalyzing enzyme